MPKRPNRQAKRRGGRQRGAGTTSRLYLEYYASQEHDFSTGSAYAQLTFKQFMDSAGPLTNRQYKIQKLQIKVTNEYNSVPAHVTAELAGHYADDTGLVSSTGRLLKPLSSVTFTLRPRRTTDWFDLDLGTLLATIGLRPVQTGSTVFGVQARLWLALGRDTFLSSSFQKRPELDTISYGTLLAQKERRRALVRALRGVTGIETLIPTAQDDSPAMACDTQVIETDVSSKQSSQPLVAHEC